MILIDFVEKKIFIKHKVDFQVLITEKVENFIKHLSASPELREGLEGIIASKLKELEKDDRAVSKAIPAELIDIIYTYVSSHKREIALGLGQLLKNPFIKMKLKAAIADIISNTSSSNCVSSEALYKAYLLWKHILKIARMMTVFYQL